MKVFLNALLLFQLFVILVVPCRNFELTTHLSRVVMPYTHFFEFTAQWTLFSPNPAPPIAVNWTILGPSGTKIRDGVFPGPEDGLFSSDRRARSNCAARWMSHPDEGTRRSLARYLCESTPGAVSVALMRTLGHERADLGVVPCSR